MVNERVEQMKRQQFISLDSQFISYFGIELFFKLVIVLILIVTAILHACNWQKEMQVVCSLLATVHTALLL